MLLIIAVYIIGAVISYGIASWCQYMIDAPYLKHLQPSYLKPWHNSITIFMSCLSWLGVIVLTVDSKKRYGKIGLMYSYKKLWNNWKQQKPKL